MVTKEKGHLREGPKKSQIGEENRFLNLLDEKDESPSLAKQLSDKLRKTSNRVKFLRI